MVFRATAIGGFSGDSLLPPPLIIEIGGVPPTGFLQSRYSEGFLPGTGYL